MFIQEVLGSSIQQTLASLTVIQCFSLAPSAKGRNVISKMLQMIRSEQFLLHNYTFVTFGNYFYNRTLLAI
jgi:hypothetical protein